MKEIFCILLLSTCLLTSIPTGAQSDPCSLEEILASFESASLSGDLQTWLNHYENGGCAMNVVQGTQELARAYSTITLATVNVAGDLATNWRGLGVAHDGTGYGEVGLDFDTVQSGNLHGVMRVRIGNGTLDSVTIDGDYSLNSDFVTDRSLWNRLLPDWNMDNVISWFSFWRVTSVSGDWGMEYLTIGIIKSNGEMRMSVYDPNDPSQPISVSILTAQG